MCWSGSTHDLYVCVSHTEPAAGTRGDASDLWLRPTAASQSRVIAFSSPQATRGRLIYMKRQVLWQPITPCHTQHILFSLLPLLRNYI